MPTQFAPPDGALPRQWPSAWPSLTRQVLLGCVFPLVVAVVVVIVLALTSSLSKAWWVALLPLLLLIWPLSLPQRVRRVMQRASDEGSLEVVHGQVGTLAKAPRRRLGVLPNAELVPGRPVRYYLNNDRRD